MAQDARVGRDRVLVENYFQHAEHYQRLANEILEAQNQAGEAAQNSGRRSNGAAEGTASDQETPVNAGGADSARPKASEAATVNGSGQGDQPEQEKQDAAEEQKPRTRRRRAPRTPQPEVKAEAVEVSSDHEDVPPAEAAEAEVAG